MQVSANIRKEGNPTILSMNRILDILKKESRPMGVTALANNSKTSLYAVKKCIQFLEQYAIVKVIRTTENRIFIILNKGSDENAGSI